MKKQLISEFVKTMLTEGVLSDKFVRDNVYDSIMKTVNMFAYGAKAKSKSQLKDNMDLRKDLKLDDDDVLQELLWNLESAFYIDEIPEKVIRKLRTVRDVINLIKSYRIDEKEWKKRDKEYKEYERGQPSIDMDAVVASLFKRKLKFDKKKKRS